MINGADRRVIGAIGAYRRVVGAYDRRFLSLHGSVLALRVASFPTGLYWFSKIGAYRRL